MEPESKNRQLEIGAARNVQAEAAGNASISPGPRPYKRSVKDELAEQYGAALEEYLQQPGEKALQNAYEIGRQAISGGLCVTEMLAMHHDALSRVLISFGAQGEESEDLMTQRGALEGRSLPVGSPQDFQHLVKSVEVFLDECLMPFEITYRGYVEANEALRVSEERYRELFENANDVIFTTDLLGNFISINRAGERMIGYVREEARRMNIGEVCAPECQEMAYRMLDRRVMGGESGPCELELLTRDGRRIPVEISCQLVCREEKPIGIQAIARDITERKRARESLRHLTQALEQEAKRIAHALHDEAGQLLASVHIALESVARELPAAQGQRVRAIQGLLDEIENQLRRLSHELRPTILDDLGLVPAIEFLTQGISARTGLPIEVEAGGVGRLPTHIEEVLYRVIQEALTNASKHAKATSINVNLRQEAREFICQVRDDGTGFDLRAALADNNERGFGLINMKERLNFVGGTCVITSSPNHGTEVLITVPLES
ncbi:MAG: PAS domain S-box protein [Acidobacteria bacterium]|nr:PAS domain S-box protein [Acidobacteriota bacterium]